LNLYHGKYILNMDTNLVKFKKLESQPQWMFRNGRLMTCKELTNTCRTNNWKGYSKCKGKKELVEFCYKQSVTVSSLKEAEESGNDNCAEEVDSDNSIICDKCGVRGHHSDKKKKEKVDQHFQTYKKFKDILNKDIKYNIIYSNCEVNSYHKKRYDLFINEHSNPGKQIILYHGTDDKNIKPIMDNGLSLTTHKIHGSVHGEGIYFSSDIDYAMLYPRNGNHIKSILVCQVYVNHMILGKLSNTTFPVQNVLAGKSIYFDTGVDSLSNPKIYVKKSVEEINILGYIQIDNRKINREPKNVFPGQRVSSGFRKKGRIKIENRTSNIIDVYWNPIRGQSLINLDIRQWKKMINSRDAAGKLYPISCWIGDSLIVGYHDKGILRDRGSKPLEYPGWKVAWSDKYVGWYWWSVDTRATTWKAPTSLARTKLVAGSSLARVQVRYVQSGLHSIPVTHRSPGTYFNIVKIITVSKDIETFIID
jgi:hypothetical protein